MAKRTVSKSYWDDHEVPDRDREINLDTAWKQLEQESCNQLDEFGEDELIESSTGELDKLAHGDKGATDMT